MTSSTNQLTVITGGSSGIGLALANNIVSTQPDTVLLVARDEKKLFSAKEQLHNQGLSEVLTFTADVTETDDIQALLKYILQLKLPVANFVHCAGTIYEAPLMMSRESLIDNQYQQHLKSAILLCQGISKLMARSKRGSIVLVSSIVASQGIPGQSVYAAMKSALHGFIASLSAELGGMNIRVNGVAPGFIETPLVEHFSSEKKQQLIAATALKRLGKPEDVADVIAFLLSEQSRFITGQVIAVDGGLKLGI
ncbi:SDR family NAD(P)-dependent oxidoreductase [Pseudoalteromonas 'SMAR']|uniref:SDR family NAD(P)-dependent oxidoreductase n=1 Tax=Pseudoalteromonas 'SMAR' TaxID=3416908 RepID=UPI003AF213E6